MFNLLFSVSCICRTGYSTHGTWGGYSTHGTWGVQSVWRCCKQIANRLLFQCLLDMFASVQYVIRHLTCNWDKAENEQ